MGGGTVSWLRSIPVYRSGSELVLAPMMSSLRVLVEEIKLVAWRTCSRTRRIGIVLVKVIALDAAGTFLHLY